MATKTRSGSSAKSQQPAAPKLAALQEMFQRALLEGDPAILETIVKSSKEQREVLLGVYANAYAGRLIDVLKTNFEKVATLLGQAEMDRLGRDYVRAYPSPFRNARWFGSHWPEFLAGALPPPQARLLSDLATLERALNDVFDAADATPLQIADLAVLTPADWPGVVFSPLTATRRITLSSNAAAVWRALNAGTATPRAELCHEPQRILTYRHDGNAHFRELGYEEGMMWDEMTKGLSFSSLCEMVSMQGGEDGAAARAAGYLPSWITAQMLAGPEEGRD